VAVEQDAARVRDLSETRAERADLEAQLATTEMELARLAAAVAGGAKLETLLTALRERERRREQLRAHLAALDTARQVD
jgi:hypothetical protein